MKNEESETITDLFEIILMALACPLCLPFMKEMQEESEEQE